MLELAQQLAIALVIYLQIRQMREARKLAREQRAEMRRDLRSIGDSLRPGFMFEDDDTPVERRR